MPHKPAKLSARQLERANRGTDLPPTGGVPLTQEALPKSITRVLHAEGVRKTYKEKRVRNDDVSEAGVEDRDAKRRRKDQEGQKQLEIKHGESLAHYSRRVEDDMRVSMAEAMHASRNMAKRARKADAKTGKSTGKSTAPKTAASKPEVTPTPADSTPTRKTEFDRRPSTTRLNDIAEAPPSFTKLPRGASKSKSKTGEVTGKAETVLSMVQRQKMEEERERAIKRYRELKESRATGWNDTKGP